MTRVLSLALDVALLPVTIPAWMVTCCVLLWAHRT